MATIKKSSVKRRRQNKTDYKARFSLLKSPLKRVVIRRTNKYVLLQLVESHEAQDKVICGLSSKELLNNGWDKKFSGSLKSIPACYLTGKIFAGKLNPKEKYIIDLGMIRNVNGSRMLSLINGLIDGGANISANSKSFPTPERIAGKHIKKEIEDLAKKINEKIGNKK